MDETFSFGAWLQQRRRALDLTQAKLGQCVGCSADHIRNLEADRRRPSKEIAERLIPCLQIPEEDRTPFLHFARGEASAQVLAPLPPHMVPLPPLPILAAPVPTPYASAQEADASRATEGQTMRLARQVAGDGPLAPGRAYLADQHAQHFLDRVAALDTRSDHFSASVRDHMARLNRNVERLTQEQYRVIQMLRGERRVRISGCAGSGKTLVAAEKAIRLANAGVHTLFLCHNPLLADHVRHLTRGSGVQVVAFGSWVAQLAGTPAGAGLVYWTNYEEPDPHTLEAAFDVLLERGPHVEAIIIDEGQDFREEWWIVVEAAFRHGHAGIFYIFHDDQQALLPHRATYPITAPTIDLSRNCRNAGKIYELMSFFHATSPIPELDLKDQGKVVITPYAPESEREAVENVVRWTVEHSYGDDMVLLLGGAQSLETSPLRGATLTIPPDHCWQAVVRDVFEHWIYLQDPHGVTFPAERKPWITAQLNQLSSDPLPRAEDLVLVSRIASHFKVDAAVRHKIRHATHFRIGWVVKDGTLQLRRPGMATTPLWAAETLLHFESTTWADGLPHPRTITLRPYYEHRDGETIAMYNVAGYKGLEADIIVLVLRGRVPLMEHELYVGISRARFLLILLVDKRSVSVLPPSWSGMYFTTAAQD